MNNLTLDNIQITQHGAPYAPGAVTLRHEGQLLAHRAGEHEGWDFTNAPKFSRQDLVALVFTILTRVR